MKYEDVKWDEWGEGKPLESFVGKTPVKIIVGSLSWRGNKYEWSFPGEHEYKDVILFVFSDNTVAYFYHQQDCCESVDIEDINGDWDDLLHTPLLVAEERTGGEEGVLSEYTESATWTFYTFRSIKGSVDVRWLGTSNGYYSEGVDFMSGVLK